MDPRLTADPPSAADLQRGLADLAARTANNPFAFTVAAFNWGQGDLADHAGPMTWQADLLRLVRDRLLTPGEAIRVAVASGHGVGKTAVVAWLILWALVTSVDCRVVATANTQSQLVAKTWPELARWLRRCVFRSWFNMTATSIVSTDPQHERTWRGDAIPWSENRPEAFAGLHNQGGRILVLFDEASGIPGEIWDVIEGATTDRDTQILWAVFGNPTRPEGRFFEAFNRFAHRWASQRVDSRTVEITNQAQIAQWIADHGEDSDFVRVRVRGEFPRSGTRQFIPSDVVLAAVNRDVATSRYDALVLGVDVARHGEDQTVIYIRKGRDGRSHPPVKLRLADTMQVASRVASLAEHHRADAVFVDATGMGWGVFDRLMQLRVRGVQAVDFSRKPDRAGFDTDMAKYANKRAEMWGLAREWLKGGSIPDDRELIEQLTAVEYGYNVRDEILLEPKDGMRARGLAPPDVADALCISLAFPAVPLRTDFLPQQVLTEYDPWAELEPQPPRFDWGPPIPSFGVPW